MPIWALPDCLSAPCARLAGSVQLFQTDQGDPFDPSRFGIYFRPTLASVCSERNCTWMHELRLNRTEAAAAGTEPARCEICRVANCQRLLAELSERARSEKRYAQAHLFSVDAHALQHPELHSPLSSQSHLLSLCLMLERGGSALAGSRKPAVEKFLAFGHTWPALDPPPAGQRGTLTVKPVFDATPAERAPLARRWAEEVWQAWQPHHPWARRMLDRLMHD